MKVITLARKPFPTSAAECAVEWGTGSVNIDGCRVGYRDAADRQANLSRPGRGDQSGNHDPDFPHLSKDWGAWAGGRGRFPSNLIFQHYPLCEIVGSREVRTGEAVRERSGGKTIFSETAKPPMENMTYGEGGKEAIPDWRCEEGCPVPDLDAQSGISTSKGHVRHNKGSWKVRKVGNVVAAVETPHTDTGGASRFFKQVKP